MSQEHSSPRSPLWHSTFWDMFLEIQKRIVGNAGYDEGLACQHAFGIANALIENDVTVEDLETISNVRFKELLQTQPEYTHMPPSGEAHLLRALRHPVPDKPDKSGLPQIIVIA